MKDSACVLPNTATQTKEYRDRWKRWWKRIGWKLALGLVVIVIGFYQEEKWRGRRALEKAESAFLAAGESLRREDFLTKAPPAAENFGATPLLAGMVRRIDQENDSRAVIEAREVLNRFCKLCSISYPDPAGKSGYPCSL